MKSERLLVLLMGLVMAHSVFAAPYVTNVVAKQRFPWGIVDISCDVAGIDEKVKGLEFAINVVSVDSGEVKKASHVYFRGEKNSADSGSLLAPTNGNYRFVWEANKDLDAGRYKNMSVRVSIRETMVQLWEGGPYWAIKNIGAKEPWEYGYYFWWGDTVGYKRENNAWVASDGSLSNFGFAESNAPTYMKDVSSLQSEGWITEDGVLAPQHDAAQAHWGGNWRMPTKEDLENLISKCTWTWTTTNNVNGYIVRGKDDFSSASIFLPVAGCGYGTSLGDAGSYGYYWSSVPYSDNSRYAWYLYFYPGYHLANYYHRFYGQPVRAVQGFTE